jgi:hypothetical protein
LFHFLVDEACRVPFGTQPAEAPFRQVLGRAFAHRVMKDACKSFEGGVLKRNVAKGLPPGFVIPEEVRRLSRTFVDLQEWRHAADYDLTERFTRSQVQLLINQVESRIEAFAKMPLSNERHFFLCCLWAWKELENRGDVRDAARARSRTV